MGEAEDALTRARTEVNDGMHIPPVHSKITVEEYGRIWLGLELALCHGRHMTLTCLGKRQTLLHCASSKV